MRFSIHAWDLKVPLQTSITILDVEASSGAVAVTYILEFPVADVSVSLSADTLHAAACEAQLRALSQQYGVATFAAAAVSLHGGMVRDTYGNDITGQAMVGSGARSSGSLSGGAVAGIVIGAIVLALLFVLAGMLLVSRRDRVGSWDRRTFRFGAKDKADPYQQTISGSSGAVRVIHVSPTKSTRELLEHSEL